MKVSLSFLFYFIYFKISHTLVENLLPLNNYQKQLLLPLNMGNDQLANQVIQKLLKKRIKENKIFIYKRRGEEINFLF